MEEMDNKLESIAFMSLYERLQEDTKLLVFRDIVKSMNPDTILHENCILDIFKPKVLSQLKDEKLKVLFKNSTDFRLILSCYTTPGYTRDIERHVKPDEWKYYFINKDGNYVVMNEMVDFYEYDIKPFDFEMIRHIDSEKVYKIWPRGNYLVEWYSI